MATVPSEVSELSFTGNGLTTAFPIPFPIQATGELVVTLTLDGETVATTQVEGVDYTVSGAPSDAPTVTMAVAPPADSTLHVERTVEITQEVNFLTAGPFSPSSHTAAHDKRTYVEQQLARRIARLEAAADLVSLAAFEAQLVELEFDTDAADVEDTWPLTLATVQAEGDSVTGVVVVKADNVDTPGTLFREPVQVTNWSWASTGATTGNLSIENVSGLEPNTSYSLRLLLITMEVT